MRKPEHLRYFVDLVRYTLDDVHALMEMAEYSTYEELTRYFKPHRIPPEYVGLAQRNPHLMWLN